MKIRWKKQLKWLSVCKQFHFTRILLVCFWGFHESCASMWCCSENFHFQLNNFCAFIHSLVRLFFLFFFIIRLVLLDTPVCGKRSVPLCVGMPDIRKDIQVISLGRLTMDSKQQKYALRYNGVSGCSVSICGHFM